MKKFILVFAAMLGMGMLVGCGGGGGGGAGSGFATTSSLSGTAADGIIKNGVVTAYQLKSDGSKGIEVGSADTDTTGAYNLDLNNSYNGGMILVEITPSTDPAKKTQMKCDDFADVRFGQWIDLDPGFKMAAVIDPEGGSVSLQITPLTNMAASRALASTPVTKESVAKANNEVSQIVGIDIVHAKIVDITDPDALADATPEGKQYALANAGLAGFLSPDVAGGETLAGNIDKLAKDFEDGKLGNSDGIKVTDFVSKMQDAATKAGNNSDIKDYCQNAITAVNTIATNIAKNTYKGVYDPEPSENAGKPAIVRAKALLQDGRTFVEQIVKNYKDPIDALDVDADTIDALSNNQVQVMAQMLGESIEQTFESLNNQTTIAKELADPASYDVSIKDSANQQIGTLTVAFSNASGVSMTINGTLKGSEQTVNITNLKLATNITADDITTDQENDNLITSLTSKNVKITASGYVGNDVASIELDDVALSVTASEPVTIDFTEDADNNGKEQYLTGASFKGGVTIKTNQIKTNASTDASFVGNADIELVSLNQNIEYADVPVSLKKISIDGTFSSDAGTFEASVTLNVDNAAAFDTFGYLDYEQHVDVYNELSFNDLSQDSKNFLNGKIDDCKQLFNPETDISYAYIEYWDDWEGNHQATLYMEGMNGDGVSESHQLTFDVPDCLKTDLLASDEANPADIVDSELYYFGAYNNAYNSDGNWKIYARGELGLKDFEDADYFVKGDLTITANANVPGMPPLSATARATRSQLRGGNVSLTLTHDGQSYTVAATSENLEAANAEATITLTNPGGVKFEIKGNADENGNWDADTIEGTVSVNGEEVGTVDVSNGVPIVRYDDGTFESIY